ncbi:GNAT family N-acetyltransferase [Paraburkholderia sp. BCC1884]|uniref:GNAT family N-acetyltransferase n=1 Tax=Paraburkholderia sp. BCC1884 TaxID=2562668 RepID=UPI00118457A0|nr:GNAT family N-acetyltransferase [Paraburkholderia sp. BCC1884]
MPTFSTTLIFPNLPTMVETDRLILRCPRLGDGLGVFDATVDALAGLRQFPASLPWALETPSIDASEAFCVAGFENFEARKDFPFLFIDKTSRIVVGCGGLHRPRWSVPAFELGFWGRSSLVGRGLFSEAADALANYAFCNFGAKRLEAICDDLNARSIRVCERIGMQLEGVLRQERRAPDGSLRNTRVYSKLA